jgi:hypothetical protein
MVRRIQSPPPEPPPPEPSPVSVVETFDPPDADAPSTIDAWLAVLVRLLRLPETQRAAIHDELEAHLQERTRDLVLGGMPETEAARTAITELGEAADLAHRLETAHRLPRRRRIMQYTLIGTGVLAVASIGTISVMSHSTPDSSVPAIFDTAVARATPPPAIADVRVSFDTDTPLNEASGLIADEIDRPILVDWEMIESDGVEMDMPLEIVATDAPVSSALEMIVQRVGDATMVPYALRYGEHAIEITYREVFDRRETTLVCYDVSPILRSLLDDYDVPYAQAVERVASLIQGLVEPDHWRSMGGDIAQLEVVGGKMFVDAPPRMQQRVKWIVDQLLQGEQAAADLARGTRAEVVDAWGQPVAGLSGADAKGGGPGRPAVGVEPPLAPGQVVTIEVFELYNAGEWFQTRRQIDTGGMIRVAGLEPVQAAGRTATQVERDLTKAAAAIMTTPLVNVYVGKLTP